jgi:hypothetical protein
MVLQLFPFDLRRPRILFPGVSQNHRSWPNCPYISDLYIVIPKATCMIMAVRILLLAAAEL